METALKTQAGAFLQLRSAETAAYSTMLKDALAEIQTMRTGEEARLSTRMAAAQEAHAARVAELQFALQTQVAELEDQTSSYLLQLRQESEAALAARVRALSLALSPRAASPMPTASPVRPPRRSQAVSLSATPERSDLPKFLTPQAAVQGWPGKPTVRSRTFGHQDSSRSFFSDTSHTFLGIASAGGERPGMHGLSSPRGLHRNEPGVLALLEDSDEEDQ